MTVAGTNAPSYVSPDFRAMKKHLVLGLLFFSVFPAASAFADDKSVCLEAVSKGQRFRDAHKLVEAREQLRLCAAAQCPAVVQTDCVNWLAEAEAGIPTVVVTATDGDGRDRLDVEVSLDGQLLTSSLQGKALAVNPGPHQLHAVSSDGAAIDQSIVVREGIKNQNIALVLASKRGAERPARGSASTWPTVGWVAGAVGLIGLGVGAVFGVKAISDKNDARCDSSNACDAGPLGDANSSATASTVAFVAGGVLVAGGAAILLFSPSRGTGASQASLAIGPLVGGSETGLLLRGSF
jgi:hypothetical protein